MFDAISLSKMLRSEVVWFPRFILICMNLLRWMNPQEENYERVEHITHCNGVREVRSIIKAYNDEDFEDLIHCQEVLAKKAVVRENGQ